MRRKSGLSPALFIASGFMGGLAVPDAPALTAPANAALLALLLLILVARVVWRLPPE